MSSPRPGRPVRGSRSGQPLNAVLDLLGRRWALRILWELRDGPMTFRTLRERCGGLSPSVLNQRLAEFREARLLESKEGEGYTLTPLALELGKVLQPLKEWADRWRQEDFEPESKE